MRQFLPWNRCRRSPPPEAEDDPARRRRGALDGRPGISRRWSKTPEMPPSSALSTSPHWTTVRPDGQPVRTVDAGLTQRIDATGHAVGGEGHVPVQLNGLMEVHSVMPTQPGGLMAVENRHVLAQRSGAGPRPTRRGREFDFVPRSTSSSSTRETLNSVRNSTRGRTMRCAADTPSEGPEMEEMRPRLVAEWDHPWGPSKSTSLRAARYVGRRDLASSSMTSQPSAEIGASSQWWTMVSSRGPLQAADAENRTRRKRSAGSAVERIEGLDHRASVIGPVVNKNARRLAIRKRRSRRAQPFEGHPPRMLLLVIPVVGQDRRQAHLSTSPAAPLWSVPRSIAARSSSVNDVIARW